MELTKKNMRNISIIIAFGIILFWSLQNYQIILNVIGFLFDVMLPFILGGCIAFILNVLMKSVEDIWNLLFKNRGLKIKRGVCLLVSLGIIIGFIYILLTMIIPEVKNTLLIIADMFPSFMKEFTHVVDSALQNFNLESLDAIPKDINWNDIGNTIANFLGKSSYSFLTTTFGITTSIFGVVFDFVLGFVFSLYILLQKEKLSMQAKKITYAYVEETKANRFFEIMSLSNRIFTKFVTGQLLEAFIIGFLCFVGMNLFAFPYAIMISSLVGVTALIPIFGAFIGTGVGAFFIMMVDPMKAIWFIIFIIVLQQLEGNLIYPKVVGKSVGLPGIWVLVAVTIGGSVYGIVGMLISVPLSSIIYSLLRENVYKRLQKKKIMIKEF